MKEYQDVVLKPVGLESHIKIKVIEAVMVLLSEIQLRKGIIFFV